MKPYVRALNRHDHDEDFHTIQQFWTEDMWRALRGSGVEMDYCYCMVIAHGFWWEEDQGYMEPPIQHEDFREAIVARPRMRCWGKGL